MLSGSQARPVEIGGGRLGEVAIGTWNDGGLERVAGGNFDVAQLCVRVFSFRVARWIDGQYAPFRQPMNLAGVYGPIARLFLQSEM